MEEIRAPRETTDLLQVIDKLVSH